MAVSKMILSEDYIINKESCFDLQFRRDIRYKRKNRPVYYSWKTQFVITAKNNEKKLLKQIQNKLSCGQIYFTKTNQRYLVQDIDNLYNIIVPFFKNYQLSGRKKKDFKLWAEAIKIIYRNKGRNLTTWNKKDFQRLIKIQKSMQEYKTKKTESFKWVSVAESIVKTLAK